MRKKISRNIIGRCGECALAIWVNDSESQKDLNGKPICVRCKYSKVMIVRSAPACEYFVKGEPKFK